MLLYFVRHFGQHTIQINLRNIFFYNANTNTRFVYFFIVKKAHSVRTSHLHLDQFFDMFFLSLQVRQRLYLEQVLSIQNVNDVAGKRDRTCLNSC